MTASVNSGSATIVRLSEVTDASLGGKALGLAKLTAMGLTVPPAFVIRDASLGQYPETLDKARVELDCEHVAVRSSAQGEDGVDASFAGQYETVLNVGAGDALRHAIDQCVASVHGERAQHYLETQTGAADVSMNLVVQRMVDARAAGVVFTADPASARRDLLVIDAVEGLGEALVSGEATPDHYAVNRAGDIVRRELVAKDPILSDTEIDQIAGQARQAARHEGQPLDLEWAIDQNGELFWLQARPITTLPADLNEFDSTLPRPDDVLTISNVSEMMPGAVCPLTLTFTGWGIDYGLQHMQVSVGARRHIQAEWQVTAAAYGHLLLNMTGNLYMSAGVLGSTAEQSAQTLCGRIVPELKELPPQPLWQRIYNTGKLLRYCLRAPAVVDIFGEDLARFSIEKRESSADMWREISGKAHFFERCMAVHIQSSALSGFLSAIVENMVSGRANDSTLEEQAEAVRLLAGATDVESAVMLEQLDNLLDAVAAHPEAKAFQSASMQHAIEWLHDTAELGAAFDDFLAQHGHRGYRELCMRDPAWRDDLTPLIQSMQAAVQGRLQAGAQQHAEAESIDWEALSRGLRWILPKAHNAIRRREHTKSQLVEVAYYFKDAFRHLGHLLHQEGALPDGDLLCFFGYDEIGGFVAAPTPAAVALAVSRREALAFQQQFEFPEISVGLPEPLEVQAAQLEDGKLWGRPASRGVVEGRVRVAHTLAEAAELSAGEILVTPITDIGWTPYFSLIGGLITDLGSSVSHGAVIAREYGLPCVVNTRQGTRALKTGDRVRLDGDRGCVSWLEPDTAT
ncbi:MAG: PEP/pyruvate-binding domain-containing protein [Pseudomonadota bacterium]